MVRVDPAPQAQARTGARKGGHRRLPRRNPREPLTAKLKSRGGPEAWVEIHARGEVLRVPGTTAIHDVVMRLNSIG